MKLDQTEVIRRGYYEWHYWGRRDWGCLGVMFGPNDVVKSRLDLTGALERIDRAPLKPQQKMEVLQTSLIPGHLHSLVYAYRYMALLSSLDVLIRYHAAMPESCFNCQKMCLMPLFMCQSGWEVMESIG